MQYYNLLDVASGDHKNHEWIKYYSLVIHVTAIDINENAKSKFDCDKFIRDDLDSNESVLYKFDNKKFDMVLSDHTIEHLKNPLKFYLSLQRITNKMLIIKTPHGWMENIFKPRTLMITSHLSHFSKTWFINNRTSDFNIVTKTNMRISLSNLIGEIEVVLRRNKK